MLNFDEIQLLIYQHAAHLTISGMKVENALKTACRLAVLSHDEGTLRKYLREAAEELEVSTALADLPRTKPTQGGASLALARPK